MARLREEHARVLGDDDQGAEMAEPEKEENRRVNIQRYHVAAYDLYRRLEEENARFTRAWEQGLVEAMAKP